MQDLDLVRKRISERLQQHRREEVNRWIAERAPDAIIVFERDGSIVYANPKAESLFGYAWPGSMVGLLAEELMPAQYRSRHEGHRARYTENPTLRTMGQGLYLQGERKDGTVFDVEINLGPCEEHCIVAVIRDVTGIREKRPDATAGQPGLDTDQAR